MDIVCSMHSSVKRAIGLDALGRMSPPNILAARTRAFAHERLEEEVMDGRSTVILNLSGDAERVVFVTALHMADGDGQRFLAQVAKWDAQLGSPIRPIVELPGSAQQFRESPLDTAQRILKTQFQVDALVEAHDVEREVSYKESQVYKVPTKYVRTVVRVKLREPLCLAGYLAQAIADEEECLPAQRSSRARPGVIGSDISDVLGEREVFVSRQPEKLIFYLWVNESEFTRLQEPENGNKIRQWLHTLDLEEQELESELL